MILSWDDANSNSIWGCCVKKLRSLCCTAVTIFSFNLYAMDEAMAERVLSRSLELEMKKEEPIAHLYRQMEEEMQRLRRERERSAREEKRGSRNERV